MNVSGSHVTLSTSVRRTAAGAEEASVLSARALDMLLWKVDIVMREKALRSIMLPGARS